MLEIAKNVGFKRSCRYALSLVVATLINSHLCIPPLRSLLIKIAGASIGDHTIIQRFTFSNAYRAGFKGLRIGNYCFVGEECLLDLADTIVLGDYVTLGARTSIFTHINVGLKSHPLHSFFPHVHAPVIIGEGTYVGANATILHGVRIGKMAVIGAGALVKEDVPDFAVVVGVPARIVRSLIPQNQQQQS
ncbi:MAG: acyltransferase [Candidatus Peregrinibacteria bacterium]